MPSFLDRLMLGRSCRGNSVSEERTGSPEFPRKPLPAEAGAAGAAGGAGRNPRGGAGPLAPCTGYICTIFYQALPLVGYFTCKTEPLIPSGLIKTQWLSRRCPRFGDGPGRGGAAKEPPPPNSKVLLASVLWRGCSIRVRDKT